MKKTILISMIFCSMITFGQTNEEIDQVELTKEIQIWNKKDNKMSFAFWIPQSYWRIASKDNPEVLEENIALIETTFENYILLFAADISISANATFTYKDDSTLRSELKIIDFKGNEHFPISNDLLPPYISAIMANITPMFSQTFGQMGEGMHFYLFNNTDSKNRVLISEKERGDFIVKHSNNEFKWTLPLVSMMPEKYCPSDNQKMKGNWKYCPIHGVKLD
ncbi:MAG: hypothetical protein ACI80H_000591 [Pseudoalteromonas distincta]|jgi:hypothetical protein